MQDRGHFPAFAIRIDFGFFFFALAFGGEMLGLRARGQIPAKPHRNTDCRDFRKTRRDNQRIGRDHPCQGRRQREGHRQAIGSTNHQIMHHLILREMAFLMRRAGRHGPKPVAARRFRFGGLRAHLRKRFSPETIGLARGSMRCLLWSRQAGQGFLLRRQMQRQQRFQRE